MYRLLGLAVSNGPPAAEFFNMPLMSFPAPPWIGTDESGKGDYFGPLVTAAVYVDEMIQAKLLRIGVRDSKKITDLTALRLAESIVDICKPRTAILELKPETYNRLYAQFKAEKKNLNTLLAWMHAKVIEELLEKSPSCPAVITDQFGDKKFLLSKLSAKAKQCGASFIQQPHAEENIAVAAASILARARFLTWMKNASAQWDMPLPKGATHVMGPLKEFIARHGKKELRLVAKLHFKITNSIS